MTIVLAAIGLHVAMGATWLLATLAVAVVGRGSATWLRAMLALPLLNVAAGIYLWGALHKGSWGATERLLVIGTFCAFIAFGLQAPVAFTVLPGWRRLARPTLTVYRISALFVLAAAAAMVASRWR